MTDLLLSLETNANYFRENLFHRASLCWLGRKDQIYSPRLSHLASFTFLSLFLPGFCFFCFPPQSHCSCSLPGVKAQLESGTGREQFWGAGLRWAPNSQPQLLFCAQFLVAHSSSHQCHHHNFCWVRYSKLLCLSSTSTRPLPLHC